MARMLAAGAGDSRAWMSDSGEARGRICVKVTGRRSLIVKLARTAGSWVYFLRIAVSFGRKRIMRGWVLLSVQRNSQLVSQFVGANGLLACEL